MNAKAKDAPSPILASLKGRSALNHHVEERVFRVPADGLEPELLAALLNLPSDLAWPATAKQRTPTKFRQLAPDEVRADPFLRAINSRLRRDRQLCVFVWDDGTVAMTVLPRVAAIPTWVPFQHHDIAQYGGFLVRDQEAPHAA